MSPSAGSYSWPEVIFLVEEAHEDGFTARALGESIFTEADELADLHAKVDQAQGESLWGGPIASAFYLLRPSRQH
jgi:hypothetical protein